jgi:nucleotide-binding universal stress UspA family protein
MPATTGGGMRVLLAIDGSPFSEAAIAEVAKRPWPPGTVVEVLTVVHVSTPMAIDPAFVMAAIHVDQTEEQRHLASVLVSAAAEQLKLSDVAVVTKVLEGTPKEVIVEEADAWDADLIVMGSHGYGRFRRMILGSVAGAVVANARCSVQVVRAKHLLHDAQPAA